jgi:hypothetical protein
LSSAPTEAHNDWRISKKQQESLASCGAFCCLLGFSGSSLPWLLLRGFQVTDEEAKTSLA